MSLIGGNMPIHRASADQRAAAVDLAAGQGALPAQDTVKNGTTYVDFDPVEFNATLPVRVQGLSAKAWAFAASTEHAFVQTRVQPSQTRCRTCSRRCRGLGPPAFDLK